MNRSKRAGREADIEATAEKMARYTLEMWDREGISAAERKRRLARFVRVTERIKRRKR